MEIWKELIVFLPQWEQAAWVILATIVSTQAWNLWRRDKHTKPRGYALGAVRMLVGTLLGTLTVWADTRDAALAVAGGLKIGMAGPALWWIFVEVTQRHFPWLASMVGEDRRRYFRETGPWSRSRRALFEDTNDVDERDAEAVRRWREDMAKVRRDD